MEGFIDPILVNRLHSFINNASTLRSQSGSQSHDRRRDIYAECGFPTSQEYNPKDISELIARDALANRANEFWPKECWKVQPDLYEDESSSNLTPFEQDWADLPRSLVSEPGYYIERDNKGSNIWEYLYRADIMCGIGRYGVILLGLDDLKVGEGLDKPVDIKALSTQSTNDPIEQIIANALNGNDPTSLSGIGSNPQSNGIAQDKARRKLQFIRVFDEANAQITARDTNIGSPRYGQPTEYQLTLDNPDDISALGSTAFNSQSARVHWTRCVHIVDNIGSNEVLGTYRLKPILNDIYTAQKSRWGSGEMFWNGASPKISFETHPQLGGDVIINKDKMRNEVELALRGLQQWWVLSGMSAKPIAPQAVDPKPFVDVCIQSICIKLDCPIPAFIGQEIGQLAGEMNVIALNNKTKERQNRQCTPRLICPFTNRLVNVGVLRPPTQGYKIDWPEITSNTEKDKAQLQQMRVSLIVMYIKNGLNAMVSPMEFMIRFLDMKDDEAQTVLEKAKQELEKQRKEQSITTQPLVPDEQTQSPATQSVEASTETVGPTTETNTTQNEIPTSAVAASAQGQSVQDTALNGAQVSSLLQITDAIAEKRYSPETGKAIIKASFPLMDVKLIDEMVNSIASFVPPKPEPTIDLKALTKPDNPNPSPITTPDNNTIPKA